MPLLSSILNYFGSDNSTDKHRAESKDQLTDSNQLKVENKEKSASKQSISEGDLSSTKNPAQAYGAPGKNEKAMEKSNETLPNNAESPGKENKCIISNSTYSDNLDNASTCDSVKSDCKNAHSSIAVSEVSTKIDSAGGKAFIANGVIDDESKVEIEAKNIDDNDNDNAVKCQEGENNDGDRHGDETYDKVDNVLSNDSCKKDDTVCSQDDSAIMETDDFSPRIENSNQSFPNENGSKNTNNEDDVNNESSKNDQEGNDEDNRKNQSSVNDQESNDEDDSKYQSSTNDGQRNGEDNSSKDVKQESISMDIDVLESTSNSLLARTDESTTSSSSDTITKSEELDDEPSSDSKHDLDENKLLNCMPCSDTSSTTSSSTMSSASRESFRECGASQVSSSSLQSKITQNMVDEEERYAQEYVEGLKNAKAKSVQELEAAPKGQTIERLNKLLDKSNVYSRFLLDKIGKQRESENERKKKKLEAQEKRAAAHAKKKEEKNAAMASSQESTGKEEKGTKHVRRSNVGRKRKREDDHTDIKETRRSPQKRSRNSQKKQKIQYSSDDDQVVPDVSEVDRPMKIDKMALKSEGDSRNKKADAPKAESKTVTPRYINGELVPQTQPVLVTGGVLRSYQVEGLEWLKGLFENGINGILADEMGLGKTLQCICLISTLIERNIKGPFLIAAPLSTLPNWVSEFKRFCPKIVTILYHGTKEERMNLRKDIAKGHRIDKELKLKNCPVVITSYEIIMRDRAELYNYHWKYVIIDEGHRIKNLNCRLIRELKKYKTANRLLLTGTPLQNNLAELWSLLNFLLPDIFDDLNCFQEWFDFSAVEKDGGHEKIIAQEQEEHVLETLHAILTPFLLRRLKTDVDLSIPPKRELIVYAPLTLEQQDFYKSTLDKTILDKIKLKANPEDAVEYTNSGRVKRKSTKGVHYKTIYEGEDEEDSQDIDLDKLLENMEAEVKRKQEMEETKRCKMKDKAVVSIRLQNILMQLRKCCNHPYLLEYPLDPVTKTFKVDEDIVRISGKMRVLDRMLTELKKRGHKVLIFSQMTSMLDIIQDFCHWRSYGYSRLDGTMKIPERQEMIEQFNTDPEVFLFLLSTRAGGLGINLSAADTCIIFDSDWNPQADLQAQDRCHRIGQTKPVLIFRLVTANTVDETVVERAASKRKLEKMVIHKGRFKGKEVSNKLTTQELLDLIKSNNDGQFSGTGQDNVISDECLNQLLDRSFLKKDSEPSKSAGLPKPFNSDVFKVVEQPEQDTLF